MAATLSDHIHDARIRAAAQRIADHPELEEYRDLLLEYGWDNQDDHLEWVATAPIAEIIAWAQDIREDENE